MSVWSRSIAVLSCSVLFVALGACKPKPGDTCTQNYDECSSPTSRLACNLGNYVMETCKGVVRL